MKKCIETIQIFENKTVFQNDLKHHSMAIKYREFDYVMNGIVTKVTEEILTILLFRNNNFIMVNNIIEKLNIVHERKRESNDRFALYIKIDRDDVRNKTVELKINHQNI